MAGVYAARAADSPEVLGYYTLSAYALERADHPLHLFLPLATVRKLGLPGAVGPPERRKK